MKITPTIFLLFVVCALQAQTGSSAPAKSTAGTINWMTIEQAEAAQKANPKKILVHIYATWCRWCRLQDSATYRNPAIVQYINENYYPVKFNAEGKQPLTYKGVKYQYIPDETHLAHDFTRYLLNGKLSYPAIVILGESGNVLDVRHGYQQAYYLEPLLYYYATNAYKQLRYTDYEGDFEGKIEAPE